MTKKVEREARESRLASGWMVEADAQATPSESGAVAPVDAVDPAGPADAVEAAEDHGGEHLQAQLSSTMLVLFGVLGGLYLLYTMVWFSWANVYSSVNAAVADGSGSLGSIMQQVVFWATPFAPLFWFLSVFALQRPHGGAAARPRRVLIWLLIGAVVLVPLPMFSFGAGA